MYNYPDFRAITHLRSLIPRPKDILDLVIQGDRSPLVKRLL